LANDLIINFTPNGMIPSKDTNSFVPITPGEIARDVRDALELGITMVHLHARDPSTGAPTYRREVYGEIIERIRASRKIWSSVSP
jgi:3-keto-5-aminohexanoate cleavage enzyme